MASSGKKKKFGAACKTVSLARYADWPSGKLAGPWWKQLAKHVAKYPKGKQSVWGIPFRASESGRVIVATAGRDETVIRLTGRADFVCFLHDWRQRPDDVSPQTPREGMVVGEYRLDYADGTSHTQPVRGRYEVTTAESPGPPWVARPLNMWPIIDPVHCAGDIFWGWGQTGTTEAHGVPLVYAMSNPHPGKQLRSLTVRGLLESPLLVAAVTLYRGVSHPLRHLPRRTYRIRTPDGPAQVKKADVDLGRVTRIERTTGPRGKQWLSADHVGLVRGEDPTDRAEDLVEAAGADDATLSVSLAGRRGRAKFSLGQAFHGGRAKDQTGELTLEVLGRRRQWMRVVVRDAATGRPTPVRIHVSGPRGEYLAPYGHHSVINPGWFMDYGADVLVGGRNWAYVSGEFTTEMPTGDAYVEISKGFEYAPVRRKVTIRPGQKVLELEIDRVADWRGDGWVTADTHVHFISPHTAALQAQGEGVNVVNLLASQWGRLFTNVGDFRGRVNVIEDETIVYVGTENRNHMLGHMSMLGTRGLPVYPMCCGGPEEAWVGDPDFLAMAEWARQNRAQGGVVIRPHFPQAGLTEDPVPIIAGLVDALEIAGPRGDSFPTQEWYRYLNCGYRVAVAGGTDKMSACTALGWTRTYALLDRARPFDYDNWAGAMRAGRTFSTNGPLIDMTVDGLRIGDAIDMSAAGGTVEVAAHAESVWPLGLIEIVFNGRVVAAQEASRGTKSIRIATRLAVDRSGWIAARCCGYDKHPAAYLAAHTSPVYVRCGDTRAFDGEAAEHMLALVEGGIEYLRTLSTAFDEASQKRMVKLFNEARRELKARLRVESGHPHHHD